MSDVQGDPIAAQEALMQFLYRAPIGLVQCASDGTVEMMNPKSAQLLMTITPDGSLDNLFDAFANHAPELRAMVEDFPEPTGIVCDAHRIAIGATAALPARTFSIDMTRIDADCLMAVVSDVTSESEREQMEIARVLRHAARVDTLTAMPNRAALRERVQTVLEREPIDPGYEFAVLHLNCDRFKQINDSFGHHAGDEVLASMAGRLRAELRPTDSVGLATETCRMAARISGDEFVVLLEGLRTPGDVHLVVTRLLETLARPYHVDGHRLHCGVSIGIAARKDVTSDADALLRDASIAMDEAKRIGGGRYAAFEPDMRQRAVRRGDVEAELRVAIAERQLFVVFQPVVGLRKAGAVDRAAGVEALVRWRHPTRGVVSPIEFIEVAEVTGLIGALGDFVLRDACAHFMGWRRDFGERAPRHLAVNVSRAQLGADDFVVSVQRVLDETGMPADRLQLEVTESLAAQDVAVQRRLHELKAIGVTLALDDFGTGYSSLSSLHLLPVDTVKIDRSFVSLVDQSLHHRVLVEATVRVARSLGMITVAEGVETEMQAAVIRDLGCDKGQGYLFSRPLPAAELSAWLGRDPLPAAA